MTHREPAESSPVPVTPGLLRSWPLPAPGGSKDVRGVTVIVGGSAETSGAVLLAAEAALRSGAGKLQVATVASAAAALGTALPEALVRGLEETGAGAVAGRSAARVVDLVRSAGSVLLGVGLTDPGESAQLTHALAPEVSGRLVLDAMALTAADPQDVVGHASVVTPNRREAARLLDADPDQVEDDPVGAAVSLAQTLRAVVSLGGPTSYVAGPDGRVWADNAGGVGLAVSGSGDVRAGILAGLLARGAEPDQAAVWATYVHGRAGERLASTVGPLGFLARELALVVPTVLLETQQ